MKYEPPHPGPSALKMAMDYLTLGWAVIDLPHKSKRPRRAQWQTLRHDAKDLERIFKGKPKNLGVLLGEPSNGLIDIDLDHPTAVELAPKYLPETPAKFGRDGKPCSHWLYRVSTPPKTRKETSYRNTNCPVSVRTRLRPTRLNRFSPTDFSNFRS